jgi:FkbM family methyltransferase
MNKIHREKINISVAFSSGLNRLRSKERSHQQNINFCSNDLHAQNMSLAASFHSRAKNLLRSLAPMACRPLKALVRPIAFRMRRYFTAVVIEEMQQTLALMNIPNESQTKQIVQKIQVTQTQLENLSSQLNSLISMVKRTEQYSLANARRVAVPCGQEEVLVKTDVGYLLCSSKDHVLLSSLVDSGELELGTRLLIQRFLKPNDVFVDIGANIGIHTLAAARALQGKGKIIAFEPFLTSAQLLQKSIFINGFSHITEIHQAAVFNIKGKQTLFLGESSGHHSLWPLNSPIVNQVEVPLVRLDDIISKEQKLNLIKIDVEGAELEVIESGKSLIKNNPDIGLIVEFGPAHLERVNRTVAEWLRIFAELELDYKVINHVTGKLENWSLEQLEQLKHAESVNLFFAGQHSSAWEKATL